MNDVFSRTQSKRLFAFIASGGTLGALTGPIVTNLLVDNLGLGYLLLISAFVLASSVPCINWLIKWENTEFDEGAFANTSHTVKDESLKDGVWDGLMLITKSPYLIGICLFVALYAVSLTFVMIYQAELIEINYVDPIERTKIFSQIDFASTAIALILQLIVTSNLIRWIGFRSTFLLIPLGITVGFVFMAAFPVILVTTVLTIFRRAGDYAIMKPAREMLFSVVSREEKYRSKNFIDTAILRTGDTSGAWLLTGAKALGASASTIPMIGVGLGVAWCSVAYWLGNQYNRLSGEQANNLQGEEAAQNA